MNSDEKLLLLIKGKLRLASDEDDASLRSSIWEVNEAIKNYTSRNVVPDKLQSTVVNIVCDLYASNKSFDATKISSNDVKSIKRGDTTIQYESTSGNGLTTANEILPKYAEELKMFRRVMAR